MAYTQITSELSLGADIINAPGEVYWITGLPGSGKTTLARALRNALAGQAVLLDGDELRVVFGAAQDYDPASRRRLADSYARLAQLLSRQGQRVIVATVSMFDAVRDWNRAHLPRYFEVYVDAPRALRHARRALYMEAAAAEQVEDHPAYELPKNPHLALLNDGSSAPQQLSDHILQSARLHFRSLNT